MTALGLSPGIISLPLDAGSNAKAGIFSLFAVAARYINCNLPPVMVSKVHAWLCVGYTREPSSGHPRLTLFRHDDAMGPYIRIDDPFKEPYDAHRPWISAMLPLPPKIYMTAERAELMGRWSFFNHLKTAAGTSSLAATDADGALTYQTYGQRSSIYKQRLIERTNFDSNLAREYRLSNWPRNIWIIEAVDRRLREEGKPFVLGEVIIDPTAHHEPTVSDPGIIATHASGFFEAWGPDHSTYRSIQTHGEPYETGQDSRFKAS